MTVTITPEALRGSVTPPPSKSQSHRLLIAAALAHGESRLTGIEPSQDVEATLRCLTELGAEFRPCPGGLLVEGMGAGPMSPLRRLALPHLDCGESGSTLRFLIPVALAVRGGGIFTGHGRLMERPLEPYLRLFREKGIFWEQKDGVLTVQGLLTPGEYPLPGNVSSQFFTGLLFALPLLGGPSAILPTTRLESMDYISMTAQAMELFGVRTMATMSLPPQYHVPGDQLYQAANLSVEADWSQAAFWYAARLLGSDVTVEGLDPGSLQGDRIVEEYASLLSRPGDVELDVSSCPDLVPPLAAMAAVRQGTTRLINAARLRLKESDRLSAISQVITALGGRVHEGPDSLTLTGVEQLAGGRVDPQGDHRIAMMAAIAAARASAPVTITDAQCVSKSYPAFWEDLQRLGGKLTVS